MDVGDMSRTQMSSKQERLIVCPKRKQNKWDDKNQNRIKVKLEHVLGLTVTTNSALDCDTKTGTIAYPAGCTIVFLSPYREKQSHLLNDSRKSVTCLTYSPDGRYLATGEYGHQPSIRIWDLTDNNNKFCEFTDHKCGINCLAFSPNQKYLVSVGSQHDMIINVWDWKSRIKIGANKVSTKVKAVAFCETGDYFVTAGNRHVKFWYIQHSKHSVNKDQPGLIGRAAILGEQQNNDFVDVVCGKGSFQDMTYVIARSGILCEFNGRRLLDRWVNVKTSYSFCITAGEDYLFIGCAESIVRCFSLSTLAFVTTLPRTHYLGVDVAKALNISHTASHPKDAKYPDTIAIVYDEVHKKLTCVYNDHSLYVWDIHDIRKVGKSNSYLYHCACIWGVETYPDVDDPAMPPGSFITCSSDDTVRIWNLEKNRMNYDGNYTYQTNIYSNELLKIIYIDSELQYIKNTDIGLLDKVETLSYDDRNGVRSMGISPDGQQLATGDRSGNIRVYRLKNAEELCKIEAHDAEILCLEYTPLLSNFNKRLLLSASRDRLIHVFDVNDFYKFVETLDDHSSSITAIRFIDVNNQLQLVSCSADKSIIFRRYQNDKNPHFVRDRLLAGKSTLYDMAVDCTQKYILTACQDRYIRVYSVNNGKLCKNFKGSVGEEGSVIKVALDNSGRYLATSCTDKTLCLFDYYSGECIACICGHSELVTGLRFSNDCEKLISASGDGCIFIWRLPRDMVVTMQTRVAQQRARFSSSSKLIYENAEDQLNELDASSHVKHEVGKDITNDIRFNDGQLPLWVTKSVNDESALIAESNSRKMMPKGRWAQRMTPFTQDGILHLPSSRESDGSKEDSSVDSGTETSRPEDRHEKLIIPQKMVRSLPKFIMADDSDRLDTDHAVKKMYRKLNSSHVTDLHDVNRTRQHTDDSSLGSFKNEDVESIEHDGDVEDYSEVESTENGSNNKVIYYETVDDALSEFKVNAIDADELRKSQRKMKRNALAKKNPILNLDITSYSVSGSQESDDDEDDDDGGGSTPSADNSEKASSLTLSSMDAFIQREKYLKGTYESLSGVEMDVSQTCDYQDKKLTISSQHHSYNSEYRNQKIIQATIHNKNDIEATRKRQELQSRLEDIRGKLECAGTHSSLKSSQSTMDLRRNDSYFVPLTPCKNNLNLIVNDFQGTHTSYPNNNIKVCFNNTNCCDAVNEYPEVSYDVHRRMNGYVATPVYYQSNNIVRPHMLNVGSNIKHIQLKNINMSLPQSPVCEKEFVPVNYIDCSKEKYLSGFYINQSNNTEWLGEEHYSSDSLDEDQEFSSPKMYRRRCVSEYQLSWKDSNVHKAAKEEVMHSYWNPSLTDINRSHSEENILNDDGDSQDNIDRHSSASFFLRKRKAFNSSESILTDESEYQFLFSTHEQFRSTESVLTDISDSNLNSQSDDMNLAEETTWSRPNKKPVMRTRSLQETKGSGIIGNVVEQDIQTKNNKVHSINMKPKNESFFIPVDGGVIKSPEEVKELFMRKINSRKKLEKNVNEPRLVDHPLVTHKPPKPQNRSVSMYLVNNKTYRKNRVPSRVMTNDGKVISEMPKKPCSIAVAKNKRNEKYGTFTKSKASLDKNLLKNHFVDKLNTKLTNVTVGEKMEYRACSKNIKSQAAKVKRAETITKYDVPSISCLSRNNSNLFESMNVNFTKLKRHSVPENLVSLSQLSNCNSNAASDNETGMRRSISLSDLSTSSMQVSKNNQRKYSEKYSYKHKDGPVHTSTPFTSPMSRSSSEITLMPPPSAHHRRNSRINNELNVPVQRGVMRPTIASQNKVKSGGSSSKTTSTSFRRKSSASTPYLVMNDVNIDDSSSDDNKSEKPRSSFSEKYGKNIKFMERSCSERDLSVLQYNKKRGQQLNEAKSEVQLFSCQLPDITNAPFSQELLNAVIEQFKKTAENIIRIHDRIAVENINESEKKMLRSSLRNTISQVLSNLRHKLEHEITIQDDFLDTAVKSTTSENLTSLAQNDNMVSMIQQYSDVLVSIVQQKFEKKPT